MSFLNRLLPPREGDLSRAVAVLPSRFAGVGPLQGPIAPAGPERALDEDASPVAAEPAPGPLAYAPASMRQPSAGIPQAPRPTTADSPVDVAARPIAGGALPVPRSPARAASSGGADPEPAVAAPSPRLAPREGAVTVRPPRISIAAEREHRGEPAPAAPNRTTSPLSAASLAYRIAKPADETAVVHVAIGRIEVVANVAPPPAARRSPTPRQPAVALADYLRGGQGGRG